jgi:nitroimidazol reductase NimA-like FMN-containing flavoprotein (pyridoxamine 5'-phosphate oxidase superfamily)
MNAPDRRVEVQRHADRSAYDREIVYGILDEALFCTVGFIHDGRPMVIPTIHVRVGDRIVLHGSPASRMLRTLRSGAEAAVTVTLLDGLVLARSVFNHSMNYRSVVLVGSAEAIDDPEEKLEAMRTFTEKILPGRWADARTPNDKEFKGTLMVGIPISAASAKIRSGPPEDDAEDLGLGVWAGVIPFATTPGAPIAAPDLDPSIPYPDYLRATYPEAP